MDVRAQTSLQAASPAEVRQAHLQLLIDTGLVLAQERDLEVIVQSSLDAARQLCNAHFGAFLYITINPDGGRGRLYRATGDTTHPRLGPLHHPGNALPLPAGTFLDVFDSAAGILHCDDLHLTPAPFLTTPFQGLPLAELPVRSLLAVPVVSRTAEPLGVLLLGHPDPRIFEHECHTYLTALAAQISASVETARLADNLTREIAFADHSRSLQNDLARRFRQALDAAQLGTWTWDRATDNLDLDERAAELFFAEPHTPTSRTGLRSRIVHQEDLTRTPARFSDTLLTTGAYTAEYRVEDGRGNSHWLAVHGLANTPPGSSSITGMIGTVQDITVRKLQEATLRQSEKLAATGRMAATIAHEINNPLEAVTNLIYLARTDPGVPQPVQRLLDTADSELARVAQIAQQTLGFYRDTTRPVDIDLTELLTAVVNLFSRKMQYKKLDCKLELDPDLHIFGLQGEVRQVFSNLLVNAIDASYNGLIRVRAHRITVKGRPGVSVLVADPGSGISAAARERLFSPFFTTKQSVGTGLGLWVTRGIVEKQGGAITFRSRTQPPTGTVFRVFLPSENRLAEAHSSPKSTLLQ